MEKSAKGRDSKLEPLPKRERRLAELEAHVLHGGDGVGHGGIQVDAGVLLLNRFLVVTVAFLGRIIGALGEGQIEIANGGRYCAIGEVPGLKASRWDDVSVLNILENGLAQGNGFLCGKISAVTTASGKIGDVGAVMVVCTDPAV